MINTAIDIIKSDLGLRKKCRHSMRIGVVVTYIEPQPICAEFVVFNRQKLRYSSVGIGDPVIQIDRWVYPVGGANFPKGSKNLRRGN